MSIKRKPTRLQLDAETIRNLSPDELDNVHGGTFWIKSWFACPDPKPDPKDPPTEPGGIPRIGPTPKPKPPKSSPITCFPNGCS